MIPFLVFLRPRSWGFEDGFLLILFFGTGGGDGDGDGMVRLWIGWDVEYPL